MISHSLGQGPRLRDRGLGSGEAALSQLAERLEPESGHHGRERAPVARPRHPPVRQLTPGGVVVEFGGRQPEGQEALRGVVGHRPAAGHRGDGLAQQPGARRVAALGQRGEAVEQQVTRRGLRLLPGADRNACRIGRPAPPAHELGRERFQQDIARLPRVLGPIIRAASSRTEVAGPAPPPRTGCRPRAAWPARARRVRQRCHAVEQRLRRRRLAGRQPRLRRPHQPRALARRRGVRSADRSRKAALLAQPPRPRARSADRSSSRLRPRPGRTPPEPGAMLAGPGPAPDR